MSERCRQYRFYPAANSNFISKYSQDDRITARACTYYPNNIKTSSLQFVMDHLTVAKGEIGQPTRIKELPDLQHLSPF